MLLLVANTCKFAVTLTCSHLVKCLKQIRVKCILIHIIAILYSLLATVNPSYH